MDPYQSTHFTGNIHRPHYVRVPGKAGGYCVHYHGRRFMATTRRRAQQLAAALDTFKPVYPNADSLAKLAAQHAVDPRALQQAERALTQLETALTLMGITQTTTATFRTLLQEKATRGKQAERLRRILKHLTVD